MAIRSPERVAEKLDLAKPSDLERAARMVVNGEVIALPFNGIFGLFGDIDSPKVAEKIAHIKQRPFDKKHVVTYLPEHIEEIADLSRVHIIRDRGTHVKDILQQLWVKDLHALGVILPAAGAAPYHLVQGEMNNATILPIWTENEDLRRLSNEVRSLGRRGLVATSANKEGQPTHWLYEELYEEFKRDLRGIAYGDFSGFSEIRRKSTSVLDFTNKIIRLHREGNVPEEELREALAKHNLQMRIGRDVIEVRGRKY